MFLGIQVRVNSQKVWSEAKNGERDWGETPKTGCFAVYSLNVLYQRWLKINFR